MQRMKKKKGERYLEISILWQPIYASFMLFLWLRVNLLSMGVPKQKASVARCLKHCLKLGRLWRDMDYSGQRTEVICKLIFIGLLLLQEVLPTLTATLLEVCKQNVSHWGNLFCSVLRNIFFPPFQAQWT